MFLTVFPGIVRSAETSAETAGEPVIRRVTNAKYIVNTSAPRETMKTFFRAMEEYSFARKNAPLEAGLQLDRAIECLDLSDFPAIIKHGVGKDTAILLKETLDRIWPENYDSIPGINGGEEKLLSWQLGETGIIIKQITEGERKDEYLFSSETVLNAGPIYRRVKHMPYLAGNGKGAGYSEPWYSEFTPVWLRRSFFGFAGWQWIGLFVSIPAALFFSMLLRRFYRRLETWLVEKFSLGSIHQGISPAKPLAYLSIIALWYIAVHLMRFEGESLSLMLTILGIFLSVTFLWLAYIGALYLIRYIEDYVMRSNLGIDDNIMRLIAKTVKVVILILGVLIVLQNLGINVVSILAGFGLGGLAFALAAKDTVSNFLGSITILSDRPFKVGDWIVMNETEGTVEEIGLRSTRIRTFYNSLVSVPNSLVATANIDNLGQRQYRRVKTRLGVDYGTPPDRIEAFLEGIKEIIKANEFTRKDYFHVVFNDFGADSLNILLYFFLEVPDWSQELVERQNIFLEIMRLAADLEIRFAFPTQTLHIESLPPKSGSASKTKPVTKQTLLRKAYDYSRSGKKARPQGQGIFTPPWKEEQD